MLRIPSFQKCADFFFFYSFLKNRPIFRVIESNTAVRHTKMRRPLTHTLTQKKKQKKKQATDLLMDENSSQRQGIPKAAS